MSDKIPQDIDDALSASMREVLQHQAQSAAELERQLGPSSEDDWAVGRRRYQLERVFWNEGGPSMARVEDHTVASAWGEVPVRVFHPSDAPMSPGLVYIHGGGFVVGHVETHDRIMRTLAEATGSVVVGVDYTLSPEAIHPQARDECVAVIDHLARHGRSWGVDPHRLAVAGDSAGAMLALESVHRLRHRAAGETGATTSPAADSVMALVLYYGTYGLTDSESLRLYGGWWDGMAPDDLRAGGAAYLGSERATSGNPSICSPRI